ncbi:GFA family protein [Reyranella sp. CPCC 100927]|uniref:GFA family protein n=1 Tax=Reyranella sp. CPCC 100927 TaxID=2599616 RepID=UPI0011B7FA3A|nr:GFA family protein [Reyranella sp. CPCC 100927]TWS99653.1 GFA family protein [Reyranella sp. CPCC 100927]
MTPPAAGGCQCGAVRYRLTAPATWTGYCHCRMCQRAHGAPAVVWLTVPSDGIVFDRGAPQWYRSSPEAERGFCTMCGSPLAWRPVATRGDDPGIDIAATTLDDSTAVAPQMHLWCDSAMPWLAIDDHLPRKPQGRAS